MMEGILLHCSGSCDQHGALEFHSDLFGVPQLGSVFDDSVVTHLFIISSATLKCRSAVLPAPPSSSIFVIHTPSQTVSAFPNSFPRVAAPTRLAKSMLGATLSGGRERRRQRAAGRSSEQRACFK